MEKELQLLESFLFNREVMPHGMGSPAAGETTQVTRPLLPADTQKGVGSPQELAEVQQPLGDLLSPRCRQISADSLPERA